MCEWGRKTMWGDVKSIGLQPLGVFVMCTQWQMLSFKKESVFSLLNIYIMYLPGQHDIHKF